MVSIECPRANAILITNIALSDHLELQYAKTDKMEFYQLMTYQDDVDLNKKLAEWETFYNFARPHSALNGKTPYERLLDKIG